MATSCSASSNGGLLTVYSPKSEADTPQKYEKYAHRTRAADLVLDFHQKSQADDSTSAAQYKLRAADTKIASYVASPTQDNPQPFNSINGHDVTERLTQVSQRLEQECLRGKSRIRCSELCIHGEKYKICHQIDLSLCEDDRSKIQIVIELAKQWQTNTKTFLFITGKKAYLCDSIAPKAYCQPYELVTWLSAHLKELHDFCYLGEVLNLGFYFQYQQSNDFRKLFKDNSAQHNHWKVEITAAEILKLHEYYPKNVCILQTFIAGKAVRVFRPDVGLVTSNRVEVIPIMRFIPSDDTVNKDRYLLKSLQQLAVFYGNSRIQWQFSDCEMGLQRYQKQWGGRATPTYKDPLYQCAIQLQHYSQTSRLAHTRVGKSCDPEVEHLNVELNKLSSDHRLSQIRRFHIFQALPEIKNFLYVLQCNLENNSIAFVLPEGIERKVIEDIGSRAESLEKNAVKQIMNLYRVQVFVTYLVQAFKDNPEFVKWLAAYPETKMPLECVFTYNKTKPVNTEILFSLCKNIPLIYRAYWNFAEHYFKGLSADRTCCSSMAFWFKANIECVRLLELYGVNQQMLMSYLQTFDDSLYPDFSKCSSLAQVWFAFAYSEKSTDRINTAMSDLKYMGLMKTQQSRGALLSKQTSA
ncbi:hypothetical protein D5018_11405 [Parashewanella curva]|uniref:Uncharacterized protein n=1 Tax=Parashewanella curva TaxID=2338552 RepID=A0A3L8PW37_9GAMM|nr:hypothetical protein [Parashewanella curva]RLV59554.1 hypothetical protein D5018_11405 [Parashewanella curva]